MRDEAIHIERLPELKCGVLIAGFDGWGNALDISKGMVSYLIRKLKAEFFAKINCDLFYRFDETRPFVRIEQGSLKSVYPPSASFYVVRNDLYESDLVILKATEPHLQWYRFVDELCSFCEKLDIKKIITLGSMYDNVLHSDKIISGIASTHELSSTLKQRNVIPIDYQGPSAIHSLIQLQAQNRGFQCMSLWCHCPYYLQGTSHFGLLSQLAHLLSLIGGFEIDTEELDVQWKKLNRQIQGLIEKNPELQTIINELRKAKVRGSWASMKESEKKGEKIIQLKDFLEPK
jgi:proteasome assembly chaperone (PAC2) family protein